MADIAEIGFKANTSELANAKAALTQLVPAAGSAERAAARLNKMMEAGTKAAVAAARADVAKANAVLSAARASDTATKSDVQAAAAAKRKAQATLDAARAAQASSNASKAAAAAADKEAASFNAAASAKKRYQSVPSAGGRSTTQASGFNDNKPMQAIDQSAGAMKANVGNIAAQFQDIGVTAAMGMNPLLIALQQGTQLSSVFAQTGGNAFQTIGAAIMQILSPTALLTIAFVALGAALLQFIDWTALAQWGLNALAAILPQVAIAVTLLGAAIAVAFAPAILSTFFGLFLTIAAGIVGAVATIIAAIGAIPLAIGLIIADLYIFRDEWAQVLGFDLIDVVKQGVNLIIGSFVAAFNDIVFVWNQLPNIIGAAAIGAANAVIRALNVMIAASIAGINKLASAVNAVGGALDSVGLGFNIGTIDGANFKFDEMANTAAADLEGAVAERNVQLKEALTKDYIGAIGGAITGAAQGAAAKLKEFSGSLDVGGGGKKKGGGGGGKSEGERFEDIVAGAERTIASLQSERDAVGQTAEATARLKYETDLLNQAQQKNIQLTPQQREQLLGLAADMAKLETETQNAKDALDFAKSATKGFLSDFISGIHQGKSVWEAFGNALNNLLDKIIDKLLNQFVDAIFTSNQALGSVGGGGGGLFGGIGKFFSSIFGFGGGLGVGLYENGGAFNNGISGHSNTVVDKPTLFAFASGAGLMGEAGPEAIMPLKRGPDGALGVQMHGNNGGGNSNSFVIAPVINVEGGSSGNAEQDQDQAVRISEAVTDAITAIVDERILQNSMYGGTMNPRGYGGN